MLERMESLDGLAAVALQCHAARIAGSAETACRWAWHVYRSLVILGVFLLIRGIAQPMFELIEERLLKDIAQRGWRYHFPVGCYLETLATWMTCSLAH